MNQYCLPAAASPRIDQTQPRLDGPTGRGILGVAWMEGESTGDMESTQGLSVEASSRGMKRQAKRRSVESSAGAWSGGSKCRVEGRGIESRDGESS